MHEGDPRVKNILGVPQKAERGIRPSVYSIVEKVADGIIVYNNFTKEHVFAPCSETEFFMSDFAYSNWFSVSDSVDEIELVSRVRFQLRAQHTYPDSCEFFCVFTTTSCNARCEYCFEKNHQIVGHMTEETAIDVAKYIASVAPSDSQFLIRWFGGEPLLNKKVIDIICEYLIANNCDFISVLSTNGYLLDAPLLIEAKEKWNLVSVNIPLDGFKETYAQKKNYIYADANPYKRVKDAIIKAVSLGFIINIELHIESANRQDLCLLIEDIKKIPDGNNLINVHCSPLYERQMDIFNPRSEIEEKSIRENQYAIIKKLIASNFHRISLSHRFRVFHCLADSKNYLAILPDGRITWCEDCLGKGVIGNIHEKGAIPSTDLEALQTFDILPECKKCSLYSDCIRFKKCNSDTPWCSDAKREFLLKKKKIAMLEEYNSLYS